MLLEAERRAEQLGEYIDSLKLALSNFKEEVDIQAAKDATEDFPLRIRSALSAMPISAEQDIRHSKKESRKGNL